MAVESYKKWIVSGIVILFALIVIFAVMSSSPYKPENSARTSTQRSAPPPGLILESNLNKVIPLEELDGDMNDPQSLALLGDKYFENSNFPQAIEIYKKVLELNPDDIDTYNDLGLAYHYVRKSDLAAETLKKGIEKMPTFQRIRLSLGFVLMSADKNEEAKLVLKEAAELEPGSEIGQEATRMLGLIK